MKRFRVGKSWGVTIILFDTEETPNDEGRRPSDMLMAVAFNPEAAEAIVYGLNQHAESMERNPDEPASRS